MIYISNEWNEIVLIYGKGNNYCTRRTAATFTKSYPNKGAFLGYVLKFIAEVMQIRSVANRKHNQPRVLNEAAQVELLASFRRKS